MLGCVLLVCPQNHLRSLYLTIAFVCDVPCVAIGIETEQNNQSNGYYVDGLYFFIMYISSHVCDVKSLNDGLLLNYILYI